MGWQNIRKLPTCITAYTFLLSVYQDLQERVWGPQGWGHPLHPKLLPHKLNIQRRSYFWQPSKKYSFLWETCTSTDLFLFNSPKREAFFLQKNGVERHSVPVEYSGVGNFCAREITCRYRHSADLDWCILLCAGDVNRGTKSKWAERQRDMIYRSTVEAIRLVHFSLCWWRKPEN